MFTYIKKNIRGFYSEFPEMLSAEEYDNLGSTYDDFLANKWVLLSEEQVAFHNEYPKANIKQTLDMFIPEPASRTLEDAKEEALSNLQNYDNSEEVNSFTINNTLRAWFTPNDRTNYKTSIDSAKILGIEQLSLFVSDIPVTLDIKSAEKMLAAIQLYADACFLATKQHELIIRNMTEIEDVDNYDYTVGYPERLNFSIDV